MEPKRVEIEESGVFFFLYGDGAVSVNDNGQNAFMLPRDFDRIQAEREAYLGGTMETTMHSVETTPTPYSSVEIATDAKGMAKPTVKVYDSDPRAAAALAVELYNSVMEQLGAK